LATEAVYILDACAVIALLQGEPGAGRVELLLKQQGRSLIHAVNVCEVYYDLLRRNANATADTLEQVLDAIGLETTDTLSPALWQSAGKLKAELRRISLADCFALALALQEKGSLVTADHHEFDPVAEAGLCPIQFIR
jgi:PIN domain nuclease of toxin-antitoxin system